MNFRHVALTFRSFAKYFVSAKGADFNFSLGQSPRISRMQTPALKARFTTVKP